MSDIRENSINMVFIHTNNGIYIVQPNFDRPSYKAKDYYKLVNDISYDNMRRLYIDSVLKQGVYISPHSKAKGNMMWYLDESNFKDVSVNIS